MTTSHRVSIGIVLSLVLATSAAPASARPFDLNRGSASDLAAPKTNALPDDPRIRSVAAAGAGYGYGSTPSLSEDSNSPRSEVVSGGGYGTTNRPATVVRVVAPSDSFDWGDAVIGAAAGLALCTIGLGGALAVSQHRTRSTATPRP